MDSLLPFFHAGTHEALALPALKRSSPRINAGAPTTQCVSQQIVLSGFSGRKAPSSMGKRSTAEVLRLRATSAVSGNSIG
jgi:hypothetical protein